MSPSSLILGSLLTGLVLLDVATGNENRANAVLPLANAHAHNDYEHRRPLLDALANGFCSVEADIYLVKGELLVAHDREDLKPGRTLQALYLDPLRERVRMNKGRVFPNGPEFTLLIDIKSDGAETYRALSKVLSGYREMLTETRDQKVTRRAVTAIISGNRAKEVIASGNPRWAGIDGRLGDLKSKMPAGLMPLISDRWTSHFKWRGEGAFPEEEQMKLKGLVDQAHASGRKIRFWATADKLPMWRALHEAGVDYINTDDLQGLAKFLRSASGQRK